MKSPRRVPWTSKAELGELYEMLFGPSSSPTTRRRGLARMNVYLSPPSCPLFLPLLHSLVSAALLPNPPPSPEETLTTRMTMAMAIVRFVNGMVDPLQTGQYARPIAHIAATLGVPPILITLRHQATHEDLPPLPLLVHSVQLAIDYLHHQAFLPILSSPEHPGSSNGQRWNYDETRAEGVVGSWKHTMKTRQREKEVGEENETGKELKKCKKMMEGVGVDAMVSMLCRPGGLVPVAKVKRSGQSQPPDYHWIWIPFLNHYTVLHPSAPIHLANHIFSILLNASLSLRHAAPSLDPEMVKAQSEGESFRSCLSAWLIWLWSHPNTDTHSEGVGLGLDEGCRDGLKRSLIPHLIYADPVLRGVWNQLIKVDPTLARLEELQNVLDDTQNVDHGQQGEREGQEEHHLMGLEEGFEVEKKMDDELHTMETRLKRIEQECQSRTMPLSSTTPVDTSDAPSGWKRLAKGEWCAAPIGIWSSA